MAKIVARLQAWIRIPSNLSSTRNHRGRVVAKDNLDHYRRRWKHSILMEPPWRMWSLAEWESKTTRKFSG